MKRDWKLIRAILLQDAQLIVQWPLEVAAEHMRLCEEMGFTHTTPPTLRDAAGTQVGIFGLPELTAKGKEAAAALQNEATTVAALEELDSAEIGHSTELVFSAARSLSEHESRLN